METRRRRPGTHAQLTQKDVTVLAEVMKYPNGIAWSGLLESLKDKLARKTLWTSLNTLKDSRLVWQDSEGHWRSDNFLSKQALFVNEVRDAVSGFQNVSVVNHNPLFFEDVPGLPEAFRPVLMDQRYVSPEETSAASWVESSSDMEEWKDKGAYYRIKTSMGPIHSLAEAYLWIVSVFSDLWKKHVISNFTPYETKVYHQYQDALVKYVDEMTGRRKELIKLRAKNAPHVRSAQKKLSEIEKEEQGLLAEGKNGEEGRPPDPERIEKLTKLKKGKEMLTGYIELLSSDKMEKRLDEGILNLDMAEGLIEFTPKGRLSSHTPDPMTIKRLLRTLKDPAKVEIHDRPLKMPKVVLALPVGGFSQEEGREDWRVLESVKKHAVGAGLTVMPDKEEEFRRAMREALEEGRRRAEAATTSRGKGL